MIEVIIDYADRVSPEDKLRLPLKFFPIFKEHVAWCKAQWGEDQARRAMTHESFNDGKPFVWTVRRISSNSHRVAWSFANPEHAMMFKLACQ